MFGWFVVFMYSCILVCIQLSVNSLPNDLVEIPRKLMNGRGIIPDHLIKFINRQGIISDYLVKFMNRRGLIPDHLVKFMNKWG